MVQRAQTSRRLLHTTATFAVLVSAPLFLITTQAHAGPDGGIVTGGSATIDVNGNTTTINQSSDRAIIRWNTYDVDAADHVRYQQPSSSSITVNRITDSKASRIDGRVSANGNIILINPNGIVFGASSVVDVGGVVATTSDIEDDNAFMTGGAVKFTKPGQPDAKIINNGTMTVRDAGLVGLVAPHVENNGIIRAKMGRVQLASGDIHTIDFAGDGLIKLEVSDAVISQSVKNTGTIEADGGDVLITAAQARNMVDALIVNTGTIRANTVEQKTGTVTVSTHGIETTVPVVPTIPAAGTGTILNTGTILTEGDDLNEAGGDITILADDITLGDGSYISAAADTDGGTIRVGGDYQGGNNVPRSNNTVVTDLATLSTSSRRYGRGGRIILWSDNTTEFYGNINANGGLEGGDGGFVEVSGKEYLAFEGTVNLLAPHGASGTLLLDPTNISISSGANANVTGTSPYAPNADSVTSVLNVTTLQNALALGNVIVQTRATGAQTGNITVDAAITWASGNTLTLDAHANIIVNQSITGGSLTMIAGTDVQLLANINGTGTLTFQTAADATTIGLGGGAGTFNISAADFPYIQSGWNNIIVGRATGTGLMTANALTWNSNLTLRSGTGGITLSGAQNVGNHDMTIITNGTVSLGATNALGGTGTLTLQQATAGTAIGLGGAAGALNMSTTSIARITDGWSLINIGRTDGSGSITMAGSATWKDNVTINAGTGVLNVTGAQTFGANNVKIITDADITLGITNSLYASGGTLTIEQRSANTTIGLGDSQTGTINLTTTEVTRLRDGFASITIGRADGTGDINIGTSTWLDPLTILSGTGDVYINNTMTMAGNGLTVTTVGGDITGTGAISQNTGNTVFTTNGGIINIGAITQTTGNLTLNSGGAAITTAAITQTTGALTMNSAGGAITLGGATGGTTTGAWNFNSGNGVIIVNGNLSKTGGTVTFDTGTGQFTANGTLSFAAATTNITAGGASGIAINNTVAQTTGALTLTTAGGSIVTNASAVMTHTTGNLTMNSNGGAINLGAALTQNGGAASGNLNINSANGLITFGGTITRLAGNVDINSGTSAITFANALSLAAANTNITTTGSGPITLNNTVSTSTGNLTLTTAGGAISTGASATITQAGGNLTMDSHGGAITIGAAVNATTGTMLLDSANGIIQTNGGITKTTGALNVNSGTSAVTMNGALNLAAAALTINAGGNVGITGTIGQTTGNTSITSTNGTITLGDTLTQTGTGAITLSTNNHAISTAALSNTTGATNITSLGGDISTGNITQTTGALTLASSGGSISTGSINSTTTGAANITSSNGTINLGGTLTKTGGTLAINSGTGSLTLNNVSFGATAVTIDSTGSSTILVNGTASQSTGSTAITNNTGAINLVNGFTHTNTGNLTLTTQGGSIISGAVSQTTGALTMDSHGGAINVTGTVTKTGGTFTADSGAGQLTLSNVALGAGSLNIITDSNLALNGTLSGTGTFVLTQASAGTSIGIGAGQSGTILIDATEFSRIQDGFSSRTIGRTDGTGAINFDALNWTDTLVLQSGTGVINLNGAQAFNGNNFTIRTDGDVTIAGNISSGTPGASAGTFALVQASAGTTMGIGDGQSGTINLTTAERSFISDGWASRIFGRVDGTGAFNILGGTWLDPLTLRSGTGQMNINGNLTMSADNSLVITTDSNLYIGGNLVGSGNGNISILTASAGTSIGIGDGQTGTLHLDDAETTRIVNGWKGIFFGATTMTGDINIGTRTWNDVLTIRNGTGLININGNQTMGANNLTISTDADIALNGNLSGSGTLTIAPTLAATSYGIGDGQSGTITFSNAELDRIVDGWGSVIIGGTTNTGAMNIAARTWNDQMTFRTGSGAMNINGNQNAQANALSFLTNSNIAINGTLTGTGTLTIAPNAATSIGIGTGQAGTMSFTDAELDNIVTGWTNVIIGAIGSAGGGAMNIAGRTWNNTMDFRTGSGALNINGDQNMGSNSLTLRTATDLAVNYILAGTGTLTIMNSGTTAGTNTMAVGDSETGQLKLTNAEIARFSPYGWTTLAFGNTGSAAFLNVGTYTWDNNVSLRNGGAVNINGVQTISNGKNLTLASNGDIVLNANLIGTGTLSMGQVSATTSMAITDSQTGTVKIDNTDLSRIGSGWSDLIFGTTATTTSTYGTFLIGAYNWNHNVTFRTLGNTINIKGTQNLGNHNLSIITSGNPAIDATADLIGTGTITIAPYATNVTIGVGGTGTVNLTEAELQRIINGWGNIVFGRADSTSAMNVAARTWNDNVTFMTGSGLLSIAGATMGANNLTIATNSALTISGALNGTGTLTIRNASGNTNIGVGDGQTGTVALSNAELTLISDGWDRVVIGSSSSFGNINIGARTWVNPMTFVTQGNVIINGAQTTTETSGTTLVYATTGGAFINNVGASAINPGTGRYLVYSVAEANDTINGLTRPTIVTNQSYNSYGPGSVTETGNVFLYSGLAAKILFLQIDDVDKAYGNTNPVFTYSYVGGLQNGDLLNDIVLGYSFSAAGSNVLDEAGTTRTISGTVTAGSGYTVQVINGTLTVVKAVLTVTADSDNRVYGDANPSLNITYSGFKNGDGEIDLDNLSTASTAATILSDVGNYTITASGGNDDNYEFVYVDGNLEITKAVLTVTSQNATREYGAADPTYNFVYSGFKNSDTQSMLDTQATGSSAATMANVGTYAITGSGAVDNNYSFNYVNSGNLSITKATLTATTQNATRVYGAAEPTLNVVYTGFRGTDTQSDIDTLATASAGTSATSGVGTYDINASGAFDNNYTFTYANNGDLTVTKALLTATVQDATRVYGAAEPTFNVIYSGFANGEAQGVIGTLANVSAGTSAISNVGNYAIVASGAVDDNYAFTYVNGNLEITKATLIVTSQNDSRVYGAANPTYSFAYTGFVNGDTELDINTLATGTSGTNGTSGVGTYTLSGSGAFDNNYTFSYVNSGNLSITKAMLTATAQNATREYGAAEPTFNVVYTGFVNGENQSVIGTLANVSAGTSATSNVGNYAITATGALDDNYAFTYVDGNLNITKAMLTATVQDATRIYGAADPAFNVVYSGFKNGETQGVIGTLATAGTAATVTDNVGNYAITATGAVDDNYAFTYVDGNLSITKATLTATASSGSREYGAANPIFTVSYSGFVNGDTDLEIDTYATASSGGATANVGTHAVTASGGLDNNYTFNYVDGALTITKATVTVTANDSIRQAGTPDPTFSASYSGFKNGETSSVIDTLATVSSSANLASPAGLYALQASGALDNNYDFIYVDGVLTLTVDPLAQPVTPTTPKVIPPTADESLSGRYIYQTFLYPVAGEALSYPQNGIVVIPEEQLYSDRDADDDFLIAVTEEVSNYNPLP